MWKSPLPANTHLGTASQTCFCVDTEPLGVGSTAIMAILSAWSTKKWTYWLYHLWKSNTTPCNPSMCSRCHPSEMKGFIIGLQLNLSVMTSRTGVSLPWTYLANLYTPYPPLVIWLWLIHNHVHSSWGFELCAWTDKLKIKSNLKRWWGGCFY